jgi:hypothetical protein
MERLVKGRERIYLDRFWNDFSVDPKKFDEASREHYARLYARPGAMHSLLVTRSAWKHLLSVDRLLDWTRGRGVADAPNQDEADASSQSRANRRQPHHDFDCGLECSQCPVITRCVTGHYRR